MAAQRNRGRILIEAAKALGFHAVGVQEARTSGPDMRIGPYYVSVTSGAIESGTHGCELWISTALSWGPEGTDLYVTLSDISITS